jgi:hypothetical protein
MEAKKVYYGMEKVKVEKLIFQNYSGSTDLLLGRTIRTHINNIDLFFVYDKIYLLVQKPNNFLCLETYDLSQLLEP